MAFRVLQIINRNNLGGLLLIACNMAQGLQNKYDIKVISGIRNEDEGDAQHLIDNYEISFQLIKTMRRSILPWQDIKSYFEIKKIIKDFRPHIVHTHAAKAGALGRLAASHAGVPIIIHLFHGHVFHNFFNPLLSKIFVFIEKYLIIV